MHSNDVWRVIGLLFVTLVGIIGLLAAIHLLSTTQLWTAVGAAWVQAVGSIAALGIAIFVMDRQNRAAVELVANSDRKTALRKARAVQALVKNCHDSVCIIMEKFQRQIETRAPDDAILSMSHAGVETLNEAVVPLRAVPLHELGSSELVHSVMGTLKNMLHLIHAMQALDAARASRVDRATIHKMIQRYVPESRSHLLDFQRGCENLANS